MTWVFQLLGSQLLFAYILTTICFLCWKLSNRGSEESKKAEPDKGQSS